MARVIEYQVATLRTDDGPVLRVGARPPVAGPTEAALLADLPRHLLAAHLDGVPTLVGDDPPAEALASATVAVVEHDAGGGYVTVGGELHGPYRSFLEALNSAGEVAVARMARTD